MLVKKIISLNSFYFINLMNISLILIILLVCCIFISKFLYLKESFLFYQSSPSTRNMSYDLRCEPRIKKTYPYWGASTIELPPQYRCLA